MIAQYDGSKFKIADKYDLLLEEYEECRREYEKYGAPYDDPEFDIEKHRENMFGDLKRGEVFILQRYMGDDVDVVIPDGVSIIKTEAFKNNARINSVVMTDSVFKIEAYAFAGCAKLSSIRLSENIDELGFDTFADCKALEHIDLPPRLKKIGISAFKRSGLKSIFIPAEVSSLSGAAFTGCDKLEAIEVDARNPYHYSVDNCIFQTKNKWLLLGLNDGTMPNDGSVAVIFSDAFKGNLRVKNVSVPEGVTWISTSAFAGCTNLESVTLPSTLETLEACAFDKCSSLKNITVPGRVKSVERFAFNSSGIQTAIIKRGVEELDENIFFNCKDLKEVYVPATVKKVCFNTFDRCNENAKIYLEAQSLPDGWNENFVKPEVILGYKSDLFD